MQARNDQDHGDTIAAIASGVGPCGITVIRISGSDALTVANQIFSTPANKTPSQFQSHTVHYGTLTDPQTGDDIDKVLLTVFRGPQSYTGEDVVEISCHGGTVTVKKALGAVFAAGAKPAGPGEFTKRAFLNGRLDLAQAEAVNDIIRAQSDEAQRIALAQVEGTLSAEVHEISDSILSVLAQIEAAVDFPEDVDEPDHTHMLAAINMCRARIEKLIAASDRGRIYREGISLAIVGRPNVGKSSLLNALLRQARAIVTPIPGTTRDVIEESVSIHGIPVVAADTAGIRSAADEVERIGIELTERTMAAAGVILVVMDASSEITADDIGIAERASNQPHIVVLNKIDLVAPSAQDAVVAGVREKLGADRVVPVSASTGTGIEPLEDLIAEVILGGSIESASGLMIANVRHKHALTSAKQSLNAATDTLNNALPIDLLSVDLIAARASLGEITGDTATEDLVDRIFSDFCIGK